MTEVIKIRISKKNRQHNGQTKKVQKDKQRSTKHTHKTNDRVTRTPIKTRAELRCSGRISHLFYKFAFFLLEEMSRPSNNKFSIVINDLTL